MLLSVFFRSRDLDDPRARCARSRTKRFLARALGRRFDSCGESSLPAIAFVEQLKKTVHRIHDRPLT
jgi:hypothetical protein